MTYKCNLFKTYMYYDLYRTKYMTYLWLICDLYMTYIELIYDLYRTKYMIYITFSQNAQLAVGPIPILPTAPDYMDYSKPFQSAGASLLIKVCLYLLFLSKFFFQLPLKLFCCFRYCLSWPDVCIFVWQSHGSITPQLWNFGIPCFV